MGLSWQQGPLAPPDKVRVHLDGIQLRLEPGQAVIPHGIDRDLTAGVGAAARKP